jgi:hypothetical protein
MIGMTKFETWPCLPAAACSLWLVWAWGLIGLSTKAWYISFPSVGTRGILFLENLALGMLKDCSPLLENLTQCHVWPSRLPGLSQSHIYVNTNQSGILIRTGFVDSEAVPQDTEPASAAAIRCVLWPEQCPQSQHQREEQQQGRLPRSNISLFCLWFGGGVVGMLKLRPWSARWWHHRVEKTSSSSDASDLYSEGVWFKSWPGHLLKVLFSLCLSPFLLNRLWRAHRWR